MREREAEVLVVWVMGERGEREDGERPQGMEERGCRAEETVDGECLQGTEERGWPVGEKGDGECPRDRVERGWMEGVMGARECPWGTEERGWLVEGKEGWGDGEFHQGRVGRVELEEVE